MFATTLISLAGIALSASVMTVGDGPNPLDRQVVLIQAGRSTCGMTRGEQFYYPHPPGTETRYIRPALPGKKLGELCAFGAATIWVWQVNCREGAALIRVIQDPKNLVDAHGRCEKLDDNGVIPLHKLQEMKRMAVGEDGWSIQEYK
jgi:hypothetical protein